MNYISGIEQLPKDVCDSMDWVTAYSGKYLLLKGRCLTMYNCKSYKRAYAEKAYCDMLNSGNKIDINGQQVYEYRISLVFLTSRFPELFNYITGENCGDAVLVFNKDFSGVIESISTEDDGGSFYVTFKAYSSTNTLSNKVEVIMNDNALVFVRDYFSLTALYNVTPSFVSEKVKSARYGTFQIAYNIERYLEMEFPVLRRTYNEGFRVEQQCVNGEFFYIDLGLFQRKLLNIVNPEPFLDYSRTINTKEFEIAKLFYIAIPNVEVLSESNSFKFNIKLSLI